jgi:type IV fimbrial biogenesis protein FimT
MKTYRGFTLIELMITLFIVSILLTVGVPSLKSFMKSNRLIASSNDLVSALHVARSEAIKLNKRVTVCSSSDGKNCANSKKWQQGWIVFVDANDDRTSTGNICKALGDINSDCILRVHDAIDDSEFSITGVHDTSGQAITWFTFTSRGLPKNGGTLQSGIFSVCSFDGATVSKSRAVVVSLPGRVHISDNAAIINCPTAP